ncbi:MAG: flagellar motor switch protein FliM [Chromatiales bacterium]|nr:flagellar motor switch protein FliM [Chromatiales bacterium]
MSVNDLLSQEEIDALLHGVDSGDVETETDEGDAASTRSYDFTSQDRIVRGRLPTLEMINERFARNFRISTFNMLRRSSEIAVGGVQMLKFSEYVHSLFVPTSLNLVRFKPLRGKALFVVEPKLVFTMVDNFFGGVGRFYNKIEGRDFTPTEQRVIRKMLDLAFADLVEAWRPVMDVNFEFLSSEVNPQFANIVSPSEVVVVSTFHVELEGGGGDLHVTLPYSMIEPIREKLDAGVQSDRAEKDERWQTTLQEEIKGARVRLNSTVARLEKPLSYVMEFEPGYIIKYLDKADTVVLRAEDVPLCRGLLTKKNGRAAVKITEWIDHRAPKSDTILPEYEDER